MSILIRNLPRAMTEDALEALFKSFGEVEACHLVIDKSTGRSKGFGFIEMPIQKERDSAINTLDATKIEKNKIRVKWSNQEAFKNTQNVSFSKENTDSKETSSQANHNG